MATNFPNISSLVSLGFTEIRSSVMNNYYTCYKDAVGGTGGGVYVVE